MPKISVIIPVFNVERYLRTCLESVINQTLFDIEIICINDGSTDCSLKILQEYKKNDSRFEIINKQNTGYGHSMNSGLKIAAGEYIAIVEPDDFIKKEMFEDLYRLAVKSDADIVKSEYYLYNSKNKITRKTNSFSKFKTNTVINIKTFPDLIKMRPAIWSGIYKNEFIKNNNINFLETPGASFQDTSFSFKTLSLANKIYLTDKAYLFYRQDNENSSIHSKNKVFAICEEFNEITNFLNKNPAIKTHVNTKKLIKQYESYIWNLKRIESEFVDEFLDEFTKTFKDFEAKNQLSKEFYKKYPKRELNLLFYNKQKFKLHIKKLIEQDNKRNRRRKLFSIRINSSGINIIFLGKQIAGAG